MLALRVGRRVLRVVVGQRIVGCGRVLAPVAPLLPVGCLIPERRLSLCPVSLVIGVVVVLRVLVLVTFFSRPPCGSLFVAVPPVKISLIPESPQGLSDVLEVHLVAGEVSTCWRSPVERPAPLRRR